VFGQGGGAGGEGQGAESEVERRKQIEQNVMSFLS
jgi:hypothetical protein